MRLQAIAEAWYKDAEEIGCVGNTKLALPQSERFRGLATTFVLKIRLFVSGLRERTLTHRGE